MGWPWGIDLEAESSRMRKRPKIQIDDKALWPSGVGRTIGWSLLILALFVGVLVVAYRTTRSLRPAEYEGKILDKWAGYSHTDEGSFPYFRVLVETDSGQKLTVAIDRDNYERAKIGMRIKKTQNGIELPQWYPMVGSAFTLGVRWQAQRDTALDSR